MSGLSLSQIDAEALNLYRDPSIWPILNDALQELSPPMRWATWLERGTLDWLAYAMVGFVGGLAGDRLGRRETIDWLRAIGARGTDYVQACEAFHVSPVMIEVGREDLNSSPARITARIVWQPPSVPLAHSTLRAYLGLDILAGDGVYTLPDGPWMSFAAIERAVRQHHPNATAYRIRIGAGEWTERAL